MLGTIFMAGIFSLSELEIHHSISSCLKTYAIFVIEAPLSMTCHISRTDSRIPSLCYTFEGYSEKLSWSCLSGLQWASCACYVHIYLSQDWESFQLLFL